MKRRDQIERIYRFRTDTFQIGVRATTLMAAIRMVEAQGHNIVSYRGSDLVWATRTRWRAVAQTAKLGRWSTQRPA